MQYFRTIAITVSIPVINAADIITENSRDVAIYNNNILRGKLIPIPNIVSSVASNHALPLVNDLMFKVVSQLTINKH